MKICNYCHNVVPDDDGIQVEKKFYCISGGCQKEYLDEVFDKQVLPDLMRTGTVIGYSSSRNKFPRGYHSAPAEFFKACEKCHKVHDTGTRYYFYYGYMGAAPEGVTPDKVVGLSNTGYLLAGRDYVFLCRSCAKGPIWNRADDFPEKLAIEIKKKPLQEKGFNAYLTETEFRKIFGF